VQLTDILASAGGLDAISRELGIDPSQAAQGAEALLPAILGGFKKQAQQQPEGLEGLGGLLGQLGGGGLLDQVLAPQPTDVRQGDNVLGQIFGSRDVSRTVAQDAASRTGLDPGLLKKMLPMLAMVVAGFMAKQAGGAMRSGTTPGAGTGEPAGGSGLGGLLGGLLGRGSGGAAGNATGGLGGLGAMLDILRMAGKAMR
jgi:hypothetical protein